MDGKTRKKYRRLELHYGGLYDRQSLTAKALERGLDREFHALFVRVPIASDGISDTRRFRQHSWRVHARRIGEIVFADPENPVIDELPRLWTRFIERCRDAARRGRTIPVPPLDRSAA